MPDPRYVPARVAPGLGVVAVTCFETRDTDVGRFRVVVIAIALNEPYFRANLPGRAVMSARRLGQVHAFVRHEAVTSEVVLRGGVDFYNYPMFIAEVDVSETDEQSRYRLAEGKEHILTLSGKRIPTPRSQRFDRLRSGPRRIHRKPRPLQIAPQKLTQLAFILDDKNAARHRRSKLPPARPPTLTSSTVTRTPMGTTSPFQLGTSERRLRGDCVFS